MTPLSRRTFSRLRASWPESIPSSLSQHPVRVDIPALRHLSTEHQLTETLGTAYHVREVLRKKEEELEEKRRKKAEQVKKPRVKKSTVDASSFVPPRQSLTALLTALHVDDVLSTARTFKAKKEESESD